PVVPLRSIELIPSHARVLVAALTIGDADEHPFAREAARTIGVTAVATDGPEPLVEPSIHVDRGSTSYAYRLPSHGPDVFLNDPLKGWGEEIDERSPNAYA